MKAVCIIASNNVVIDGDVVFNKPSKSPFKCTIYSKFKVYISPNGVLCATSFTKNMPLKVKLLWILHMIILRKSHVYLTGVLRK